MSNYANKLMKGEKMPRSWAGKIGNKEKVASETLNGIIRRAKKGLRLLKEKKYRTLGAFAEGIEESATGLKYTAEDLSGFRSRMFETAVGMKRPDFAQIKEFMLLMLLTRQFMFMVGQKKQIIIH